jgi:hypothetical protein
MADPPTPYVSAKPGDLITAENWNEMQIDIKQDIAKQIATSIAGVKSVDHATDADQIANMSLADLTSYILKQVFMQIPGRTGYMRVFCNLEYVIPPQVKAKLIPHGLMAYPVTDVYQLNYFTAVCAKNDKPEDATAEWLLFYLYHADERRLRIPPNNDPIDIETDPKFRVLWKTLIDQFVEQKLMNYTDDNTIDDLEVDFWEAMFKPPNDSFDPDSYCHSPWFEKCCGEKRTVGDLKKHGDFDDIYLKIQPVKTINFPDPITTQEPNNVPAPMNVEVGHLDLNTVALALRLAPVYRPFASSQGKTPIQPPQPANYTAFLPVMVLLKV